MFLFFRFLKPTKPPTSSLPPVLPTPHDEYLAPNVSAAHGSGTRGFNVSDNSSSGITDHVIDYTTALTLTVAIGLSLLVLNIILFAALLYKKDRNSTMQKMKYDSVSVQPLCTVDSGISRANTSVHESITNSGKDAHGSCSTADIQCTELHTFPTPPDIGDRNTEVTFHSTNSLHSLLNQPTSQFIPPPPLLATTPPTPTIGEMHTNILESEACSSSGCVPVTNGYSEIVNGTTFSDSLGYVYSQNTIYQGGVLYNNKEQICTDVITCPVSLDTCSYTPTNNGSQCQTQKCSGKYSSPNVNQSTSFHESFSNSPTHCSTASIYPYSNNSTISSCQAGKSANYQSTSQHFSDSSNPKPPLFSNEQFYKETSNSSSSRNVSNSSRSVPSASRSSTLNRQQQQHCSSSPSSTTSRNISASTRSTPYDTLTRQNSKDKEKN